MKIYLSNKMAGIPYFNAPWFDAAAAQLRALVGVEEVFNPADHDREQGFEPMECPNGTFEEAAAHGFKLEHALVADWTWIGTWADCVVVGPLWTDSPGGISEVGCIQGLRKPAYEYEVFLKHYYAPLGDAAAALAPSPYLLQHALPPIMELGGRSLFTSKDGSWDYTRPTRDGRYVN